jgi:hypothetical protein
MAAHARRAVGGLAATVQARVSDANSVRAYVWACTYTMPKSSQSDTDVLIGNP